MSLSRLTAGCLLCVSSFASAGDAETSCPQTYREGSKIGSLIDASVFADAPANRAELMPDLETSEWDITPNQAYAEQRGEPMYLVCRYKGTQGTIQLKIPYAATRCVVKGIAGGKTYAGCVPAKSLVVKPAQRK